MMMTTTTPTRASGPSNSLLVPPVGVQDAHQAERDARDATRTVAPMKPAADAIVIDTSRMGMNEVFEQVLGMISEAGA